MSEELEENEILDLSLGEMGSSNIAFGNLSPDEIICNSPLMYHTPEGPLMYHTPEGRVLTGVWYDPDTNKLITHTSSGETMELSLGDKGLTFKKSLPDKMTLEKIDNKTIKEDPINSRFDILDL